MTDHTTENDVKVLDVLRELMERADQAIASLDDLQAKASTSQESARLTAKSDGATVIGGYIWEALRRAEALVIPPGSTTGGDPS